MRIPIWSFLLLSLLFLPHVESDASENGDLESIFPLETTHSICPNSSEMLHECEMRYRKCRKHQPTATRCFGTFTDCIENPKVSNDTNCQMFVDLAVQKNRFLHSEVMDQLIRDCGYMEHRDDEDEVLKLKTVSEILSWNNCSEGQTTFESNMVVLDVKTSRDLPIPFDRFRCGWQLGSAGRVLSRAWVVEACDSRMFEQLNHCCAQHLNCYMEQNGQKACDRSNSICNTNVLRRAPPSVSCKAYVNKSERVMNESQSVYEKAGDTKAILREFDGNLHKSGGFREPPVGSPLFRVNVYTLDRKGGLNPSASRAFEDIMGAGWSKRVYLDSCAMKFELHRRIETELTSLIRLNACLSDILGRSEELEEAVGVFDKLVTRFIDDDENKLTVKGLEKILDEKLGGTYYAIRVLEIVVLVIYILLPVGKCIYKRCKRNTNGTATGEGGGEDPERGAAGEVEEGRAARGGAVGENGDAQGGIELRELRSGNRSVSGSQDDFEHVPRSETKEETVTGGQQPENQKLITSDYR